MSYRYEAALATRPARMIMKMISPRIAGPPPPELLELREGTAAVMWPYPTAIAVVPAHFRHV